MNNSEFVTASLKIPAAIGGALMLALLMGSLIGSDDLERLAMIWGVGGAILWVVYFYQYTWSLAIFFCYLGFTYIPAGFQLDALHITAAMGLTLAGIFLWQKRTLKASPLLEKAGIRAFTLSQSALLLYVAGHFLYNWAFPYSPADFQLKNALKSYFAIVAPSVLMLYFANRPAGIAPKPNFVRTVAWLAAFALIINIGIKAYQIWAGIGADLSDFGDVTEMILVPILNGTANPYVLRGTGPLAMFLGVLLLTAPSAPKKIAPSNLLCVALVCAGTAGALVSGGRGAVFLGVTLCALTLAVRGKFALLASLAVICGGMLLILNLMAGTINDRAPVFVQRSLQWGLIQKNEVINNNIAGSSDWRYELFQRALAEWKSDPRILFFGRATYGFGERDEMAMSIDSNEASLVTALRRGATHNMLTDLLVAYGAVGALLYFISLFFTFRMMFRLYRFVPDDWGVKTLLLFYLIPALPGFVMSLVAGGVGDIAAAWFLVVILARTRVVENEAALVDLANAKELRLTRGLRQAIASGGERGWLVPQPR